MRGSCDELESKIDYGFLVDMDNIKRNIDKGIEFTGYTKTKIILDKKSKKWTVVLLKDGSTVMSLDSEVRLILTSFCSKECIYQKKLPMGPLKWNIPPNICGDDKSERKIFLTACSGTEFACHDSQCVSINKR
jgi:hypothetical protein